MQLKVFWWVVIIYSMLVLLLIYIYQFTPMPQIFQKFMGLNATV